MPSISSTLNCIFSIFFFCFLLLAPQSTVFAAPSSTAITFKQVILPVRFVYVDSNGQINNIWNNVTTIDDLYVVKFFNNIDKSEIPQTDSLIERYTEIISNTSSFNQGEIYKINKLSSNNSKINNLDISFQYTTLGLNEIHTYF